MGAAKTYLDEGSRLDIARGLFKVTSHDSTLGELHGLCPVHNEKNPSFAYNYKKDQYNCLSCTASGDLIKLFCFVNGLDVKKGFSEFCRQNGIEISGAGKSKVEKDIRVNDLETAFKMFPLLPDPWLKRLKIKRGWAKETLERFDIRLQTHYQRKEDGRLIKLKYPERIAIPIRDSDGVLHNVRLYKPGAESMKIISWGAGYGSSRLFPAVPDKNGYILLCEGEQDTLCALSYGFNAITQTSKRKVWPKNHKEIFKARDVVIAYDADMAGQKYAAFAADSLADTAASIKRLTWPDEMGRQTDGTWPENHGEDLTDFFVKYHRRPADLQDLVDQAVVCEKKPAPSDGYMEFFDIGAMGRLSFKPVSLAEKVLQDISLLTDPQTGLQYMFNDQHWEPIADEYIAARCIKYLAVEAQQNRVKDAAFLVRNMAVIERGRELNDKPEWVCLKNCMFNIYSGETRPHDKNYNATIGLNVEFHPDQSTDCQRWIQYLDEVIKTPEVIDQLQEFAGYCLTRGVEYGKCLMLIGPGADGKSIFLKTLRKLVGPDNCSAVSFQDLEDQFVRSGLYGKLVNISTEVGSRALESSYFKAIVTGDPITAAFKHKNQFTWVPYCKLAFAGNRMPRIKDNSDGFHRRVLPVQFKQQFLDGGDLELENKIEVELSGIFLWAVAGLHRLRQQKGFTDCQETQDLLLDYRRANNPVISFVEDECILDDDAEIAKDDLYKAFKAYCLASGYSAFNKNNFYRELYLAVTNIHRYRARTGNLRINKIKGIDLESAIFDNE